MILIEFASGENLKDEFKIFMTLMIYLRLVDDTTGFK